MCIIADSVDKVANTKIFVGTDGKGRQITVYGNEVTSPYSVLQNAMILPVPYPDTVQFHDLTHYKSIFSKLEGAFTSTHHTNSKSYSLASRSFGADTLEVHNVGSYVVSLAKNLKDLTRVDASVFTVPGDCAAMLRENYGEPYWGFIICRLKAGNHEYHPFGYSHRALDPYFIPTKHYHKHASHGGAYLADGSYAGSSDLSMDWDHLIYIHNGAYATGMHRYEWNGKTPLKSDRLTFNLAPTKSMECRSISGSGLSNIDIRVPIVC